MVEDAKKAEYKVINDGSIRSIVEICKEVNLIEESKFCLAINGKENSLSNIFNDNEKLRIDERDIISDSQIGFFSFETSNRLLFRNALPYFAKEFDGKEVNMYFDTSLKWACDGKSSRPKGNPQFVKIFKLCFDFRSKNKVNSKDFLGDVLNIICSSKDKRADRCIFELIHDSGIEYHDGSYVWNESGFNIHGYGLSLLKKISDLFSDCESTTSKKKLGNKLEWDLGVKFPVAA